ncbi:MAG: Gfo/Idh/MocA family oxidoreductase [Ferruginibacter sp.]
MDHSFNRRKFIRTTAAAGFGFGIAGTAAGMGLGAKGYANPMNWGHNILTKGRVGMIGLDTSHCVAFAELLNDAKAGPSLASFPIVAAYPKGSRDIESSASRIPAITEEIKKFGVEIVNSIEELLPKVDVVMLETNDGRLHLEQALPVLKAGKRLFIDKPIASSLADAMAIFEAAKKYNTPVFSSSSLRFNPGLQDIAKGIIAGKVQGADVYSPCKLEKTHPDLFWYGIHGVETLYTVMGTGCKKVVRVHTAGTDIVVGTWENDRIGTYRGLRGEVYDYGGTIFGDKSIVPIPPYSDYKELLIQVIEFFRTGNVPVSQEETLEICAFMEAADESKKRGGQEVSLDEIFKKAKAR